MKNVGALSLIFKISIALWVFQCSCKKKERPEAEIPVSPTTGTRMQFTLDSIFLYSSQVYLWNDVLPDYYSFNPRGKYGSILPELNAFKSELFDISQLKINPVTSLPFEFQQSPGIPRYSYLESGGIVSGRNAAISTVAKAVNKSSLINSGSKQVAYISISSFPELSSCKAELDNIFLEFASAGPENIVVDLRSNGGGYVETAEYIANLIVPPALNGKVMFSEQFNTQMSTGKATILKHQPYLDENGQPVWYNGRNATMADVDYTEAGNTYKFNKKGSLTSIKDVFFIVSGRTASASELLISSLKPYFEVRLIGETTYGKPVGFFGISIDQYSIYLSSFIIRNATGWSDYFNGMVPDVYQQGDANPSLGDPNELCLKRTLELINNAGLSFRPSVIQEHVMRSAAPSSAEIKFAPIIETRLKLKPQIK